MRLRGSPTDQPAGRRQPYPLGLGLVAYGLILAAYFIVRYGAQWMEGDSARLTQAIQAVYDQGAINPSGAVYQHGFGYPTVSAFTVAVIGVSPQTLQTVIYPFIAALALGLTSLAFFRQVTRDPGAAALASLLLFLQPDMLFVTFRGSHEKLVWPLMMVALTLLCRSVAQPVRKTAVYVGMFYVVLFAMIATNVFFASTFVTAVTLSLALGIALAPFLKRYGNFPAADLKRLVYISAAGGVLIFTFMTYIYPLALLNLRLLDTIVAQVSALLLSFEIRAQPYEYIGTAWVSPQAYLGLTAFTWLLIVASMAEWLRRGRQMLRGQETFGLRESLDWLLYVGFALQVSISVLMDYAGVLGGNLQLRVFPGFTVAAVAVLARGLWRVLSVPRPHRRSWRPGLVAVGLGVAWFSLASVFKASNEPTWNNKWIFYSPAEAASIHWTEGHMRSVTLWTGFDERLIEVRAFFYGYRSGSANVYTAFEYKPTVRYVLFSEGERLRGLRMGLAMPAVLDWNQMYDNGGLQLYQRPPRTPYQR